MFIWKCNYKYYIIVSAEGNVKVTCHSNVKWREKRIWPLWKLQLRSYDYIKIRSKELITMHHMNTSQGRIRIHYFEKYFCLFWHEQTQSESGLGAMFILQTTEVSLTLLFLYVTTRVFLHVEWQFCTDIHWQSFFIIYAFLLLL